MSEDSRSGIDSTPADEMPDIEGDPGASTNQSKRENMIRLLQYAADELGKSPTMEEFGSLDVDVSADTIKYTFNTWNEAKEAAGLEVCKRGRGTVRSINETYFESIDSPKKAYWLGALLATSSIQPQNNAEGCALSIGRVEDKAYFVTEFADEVDSEYSISWRPQNKSNKQQVQIQITNPNFVKHLIHAGYPEPDDEPGQFPVISDEYRAPFLRGFLESNGYFSTIGWQITVANLQRGEMLQEWFKRYGAKRPTISALDDESVVVRVANPFDIKAIFESLWPDILQTEPSWKPYPKKILQHLESEYPYPENLHYLSE
jgi:hypothetical protein